MNADIKGHNTEIESENTELENNNAEEQIESIADFVEMTKIRLGKSNRYFYMDFSDTDFPNRLLKGRKEIANFFDKKREELGVDNIDDINTKDYSMEEIEHILKLSREIDEFVRGQIDYIFGYKISKDVFGIASSTSVTRNGEYYFDSFLNSVLPLVEREYKVRIKSTNERIKKYTDQKGRYPAHPALKK